MNWPIRSPYNLLLLLSASNALSNAVIELVCGGFAVFLDD